MQKATSSSSSYSPVSLVKSSFDLIVVVFIKHSPIGLSSHAIHGDRGTGMVTKGEVDIQQGKVKEWSCKERVTNYKVIVTRRGRR